MINFVVYQYSFQKTGEENLFNNKSDKELNQDLVSILKDKYKKGEMLNLYFQPSSDGKNQRTQEIIKYNNEITANAEGIFLILLHDERDKKITPINSTEKEGIKDYPWCWIVIDTRPDSRLILVQKKSDTFSNKIDYVADNLFGDYFEKELGLNIVDINLHLEKRISDGKLWSVVKQRTQLSNDRLKSLCLKLRNKMVEEDPEEANEIDRALQLVLLKMNSTDGEFKLNVQTDPNDILMGKMPDFIGIAETLLSYNYSIRADFAKSGSFECGKNTETIYGTSQVIVDNFCKTKEEGNNAVDPMALKNWIDEVINTDNTFHYSDILTKYGRSKRKSNKSA